MISNSNNDQVCPHCGKAVDPLRSPAVSVVEGRITHFCSPDCRERHLKRAIEPSAPPEQTALKKSALEAEPSTEDAPTPQKKGGTNKVEARGSLLIRNQLIETVGATALLLISLFLPSLLSGMIVVAAVGAGILAFLVHGVVSDRRLGAARMVEAAAVPIAAAAVLACSCFGLTSRLASITAASLLLARSIGLLLELLGRKRSGVLFTIEGTARWAISSSWKDNSKMAVRIRRVVLTLEWARYPAAALIGLLVYLLHSKSVSEALISGATALMALDPRALRMATGDAHLAAAIAAALRKVTIRDAHIVDRISSARIAFFMTSRSLVDRKLSVVDWQPAQGVDEKKALDALASLEARAEGRIASAVLDFIEARNISPTPIQKPDQVPGMGLFGDTDWGFAICGSRSLLLDKEVSTGMLEDRAATIEKSGRRAVFLAIDGEIAAVFGIEETPVSGVQQVTQQLKSMGLEPQMMTSAEVDAAQALGQRVGIESVRFLTLENDLGAVLSNISGAGDVAVLVGRGPAFEENLMSAAAAIAVGKNTPTQAGVDAGSQDVRIVPWIVKTAKRAKLSIEINLAAAGAAVATGLALSAGWFSPFIVPLAASLSFAAAALTTLNGPYPLIESIFDQIKKTVKKINRAAARRWSIDR
jgi:cation transport ATPase